MQDFKNLRINATERPVSGFGSITCGNLSIGPGGLEVSGQKTSSIASLEELDGVHEAKDILGYGASGVVRKVTHRPTNKVYALKTMTIGNSEQLLTEKELIELKALHQSHHPCIVSFHGAFYNDGSLSILLEYMDRGTIADLLKKHKVIPENVLSKIAHCIVMGLEYLHKDLHLIHRDIKPQNILMNSEGHVKITDFGVSGEIAHSAAFANTFVGTLKYMSPERIQGGRHSAKSDIWSLGIVIMECAMGSYPYGDETKMSYFDLLGSIVNKSIPELPPHFSSDFKDFVSQSLEKNEAKRPESYLLSQHCWLTKYDTDGINIKEWL